MVIVRLSIRLGLLAALLFTSALSSILPDIGSAALSISAHDCHDAGQPCQDDHSSSNENSREGDLDDFDSAMPHLSFASSPAACRHGSGYRLRLSDGFPPRLMAPPEDSLVG